MVQSITKTITIQMGLACSSYYAILHPLSAQVPKGPNPRALPLLDVLCRTLEYSTQGLKRTWMWARDQLRLKKDACESHLKRSSVPVPLRLHDEQGLDFRDIIIPTLHLSFSTEGVLWYKGFWSDGLWIQGLLNFWNWGRIVGCKDEVLIWLLTIGCKI